MTDVPGHSIGLVPILADAGVSLLHVGVNPASHLLMFRQLFVGVMVMLITVLYESGYGRLIHSWQWRWFSLFTYQ